MGLEDFLLFASPSQHYNGTGWTSYTRGAELEEIGLVDTDLFAPFTSPYVDRKGYGGSLIINWDFDKVAVTSVTGYGNFKREELIDSDGNEIQDSNQYFTSDLSMWSQELRVATNTDGPAHWIVGANVASDKLEQLTMFVAPENIDFPGVGGQNPTQKRDIWAVFSHVDWQFSNLWVLVAGLRYTSEKRKQRDISTYKMGQAMDIVELLSGGVFAPDYNDPFATGVPLTDYLY